MHRFIKVFMFEFSITGNIINKQRDVERTQSSRISAGKEQQKKPIDHDRSAFYCRSYRMRRYATMFAPPFFALIVADAA